MSIPETLNHYRILGPLGKGGMGEVFVAEDTKLHRKVALKVLSRLMAGDPERRGRFEREAQAVAALNHPNIVTIHSVEEADGIPFLTMELVEGRPLGDIITSAGLPVDMLLRIGIGVSDAIAAAHQRGITHRDLKPANIVITADGRVKVLDFGLAKLRDAHLQGNADEETRMPSSDLTGEGRIIGTVAYMSPEQAEGKPVDQRSDIFSLGVVLHEMATGERPFKGDTNVSVISSILKDTPSSITDLNPSLPPGLAKVIRRALSKDPSRRYQTATDLRNELEELKQELDSGITLSGSRPAPAIARRGSKRPLAIVAGVLVTALLAASVFYLMKARRGGGATSIEVDRIARLTSSGNAFLAALSPDGRYVVHVKNDDGALSLWVRQTATTSDVQIVPPARVRYDGVTYAPDGNHVYYVTYDLTGGVGTLYRVAALGGTPQRIQDDVDSRISFAPDGKRYTFTRGAPAQGTSFLMIASVDGGEARQLARLDPPDQFTLNGPGWSPDGRTIAVVAQSLKDGPHAVVIAVDAESGAVTRMADRWTGATDVAWLPDGKSFLVCAADFTSGSQQLWQITYPGGERRRVTNDLNTYISVSVSGDGRQIATVQAETIANIWISPHDAIDSGRQITRGRRTDGLNGVAWLSDDTIVFSSATAGRPQVWRVDVSGENLRQMTTQDDPVFAASATPDGRFIAFQRFNAGGMHIWRMSADGSDQRQLTNGSLDLTPVAGPDGFVYFNTVSAGAPRSWKVSLDGGAPVSLGDAYFRPADISADGKELLGISWDEQARRSVVAIMPAAGGPLAFLPGLPVFGLSWTPDGSVTYMAPGAGGTGIFRASRDGARREQIATIPENVFSYAWSPDGKRIAMARGQGSNDVVLITVKGGVDE